MQSVKIYGHINEFIPPIEEINLVLGYRNLRQEKELLFEKKSILKSRNFLNQFREATEIKIVDQRIIEITNEIEHMERLIENIPALIFGVFSGYVSKRNRIEIWENVVPFDNRDAETIFDCIKEVTRKAEQIPIKLNQIIWIYKSSFYRVQGIYTDEQFKLLIMEDFDKERRKFERLKHKFSTDEEESTIRRPRIPENIRVEVWRRDSGKCARCQSRENLEYDHIIPLSKGGSNTARNIELLCEKCNRSKGAEIA